MKSHSFHLGRLFYTRTKIGAILSTQVGEHGGKMGQEAVGWKRVGPTGIHRRAGRLSGYKAVWFVVLVGHVFRAWRHGVLR